MATSVSFNGKSFSIPSTSDETWSGSGGVDGFLIEVANNSLQKTGGLFSLSADLDLGPTAGFKALYFKSRSSDIASTGNFRLANADSIAFRNYANDGDLVLQPNSSDVMEFNGNPLLTTTGVINASKALVSDGSSNITSSSVTATELGYLSGVTSAIQTQINANVADIATNTSDISTLNTDLSAHESTTSGTHGVSGTIVGTSDSQTLTNKTIDTASNTLQSTGASNGQVLTANGSNGTSWTTPATRNFLLNSNFDLWQRGTSVTFSNGNTKYLADRWYVVNSLGSSGSITYSQVAGTNPGAKYGASVQITLAPTASQANGCELYQVLENRDSLQLYNQTASFSIKVKALGNVNQVGVQFFYKTTEAKVDTAIGSETLSTVNSSGFTPCTINGQTLGTAMTTSGVIGVRIRITGVSSGNTYDLNNGFVVEQAMLNLGSVVAPYRTAGNCFAHELALCQRFYEKSYDVDTPIGTATIVGAVFFNTGNSTLGQRAVHVPFKVTKRAVPSSSNNYIDEAGNLSRVSGLAADGSTTSNNITPGGLTRTGTQGFSLFINSSTAGGLSFQWQADSEI